MQLNLNSSTPALKTVLTREHGLSNLSGLYINSTEEFVCGPSCSVTSGMMLILSHSIAVISSAFCFANLLKSPHDFVV